MGEIINKVANSSLITIDLAHIFAAEISPKIKILDIQQFLNDGQILIEKEFRRHLQQFDWAVYQKKIVYLTCSGDPILPGWAFLLIQCKLAPFAEFCGTGTEDDFNNYALQHYIRNMDLNNFLGAPIIIKGCGNMKISEQTYLTLISKLYPIAKSLMYGEACSTVPLYKNR